MAAAALHALHSPCGTVVPLIVSSPNAFDTTCMLCLPEMFVLLSWSDCTACYASMLWLRCILYLIALDRCTACYPAAWCSNLQQITLQCASMNGDAYWLQGIKWRQAGVLSQLKTVAEAAKVIVALQGLSLYPWMLHCKDNQHRFSERLLLVSSALIQPVACVPLASQILHPNIYSGCGSQCP